MFVVNINAIKEYLDSSGLKQKVVAERAGLDSNKFCLILQGKRRLEASEYANICKTVGVPMDKFLQARDTDNNDQKAG